MRIPTFTTFQTSVDQLQRRQQGLAEAQERLTSGRRVVLPSDDPAAAARAERALAMQARAESAQRTLAASRNVMTQAEGALGDGVETLQSVRELLVSAGNGSFSDRERADIAQQVRALRTQLLAIANRGDGAGAALFGGQGATAVPFVDAPGGVRFDGIAGQTLVVAGESLPMTADGRATWLSVADPAGGTTPLSVFDLLDAVADALATPGRDSATIGAGVRDGLAQLDAALDHLGAARAAFGASLSRADVIEQRLGQLVLGAQTARSEAEDLDMVQAISDFQNRQTGYDAALRAYSMVQRMSLLNYLGS